MKKRIKYFILTWLVMIYLVLIWNSNSFNLELDNVCFLAFVLEKNMM